MYRGRNLIKNNNTKKVLVVLLGATLALTSFFLGTVKSSSGEIYIVLNPSLGNITVEDIKKAYKGEISKIHGKDVILYEPPLDSQCKKIFIEKFLGMDVESYRKIWLVKLMGGNPIPKVAKEDEIVKKVSSQEGAVGYVANPVQEDLVKVMAVK